MAGSVFVVLSVFDTNNNLASIETQEAVQDFLREPPGDGLGLDIDQAISALRLLGMVAAACAAACAILGYQVLRRQRSARLPLTLLALPLFLTGLTTGGVMSAVVAASAVMLWLQPSRSWLDGTPEPARTPRQQVAVGAASEPQPAAPAAPAVVAAPAASTAPYGSRPVLDPGPRAARPSVVTWACALTWTFAGLTLGGMGLTGLAFLVAPDAVLDEVRKQNPELADQGFTDARIEATVLVVCAVFVVWSLLALVLAGFTFLGARWAWLGLMVSASVAATLCAVGTLGAFVLVVPLAATVATVVFLSRPEARSWFRGGSA